MPVEYASVDVSFVVLAVVWLPVAVLQLLHGPACAFLVAVFASDLQAVRCHVAQGYHKLIVQVV